MVDANIRIAEDIENKFFTRLDSFCRENKTSACCGSSHGDASECQKRLCGWTSECHKPACLLALVEMGRVCEQCWAWTWSTSVLECHSHLHFASRRTAGRNRKKSS